MKTINKLFKGIFFCTLVSVSVSSCDLEVEPPANIAAETYWTSEKDAWYNLNSIYSAAIPGIGIYGDAYSDDVYCQYAHESNAKIFQQDGFSPLYDEGWNFETIRKENLFLQKVGNCEMDESLRERFKAEVRAMRAWTYLGMTMTFGKVPLITEVLDYNSPNIPRDEVSVIRDFIMKELTEAAAILPEKYAGGYPNEKGRITKYACLSLKARAALYFGDYALAESTAKEVMDKGGFSLFKISSLSDAQKKEAEEMSLYIDFAEKGIDKDEFVKGMFNYEALWHTENANPDNPEYIMTRQYAASSWDYQDMTRYTSMRPNQLGGWSSVTPTQNLVDAYWGVDGHSVPQLPTPEERAKAYNQIKADLDAYQKPEGEAKFIAFCQEKIKNGTLKDYKYIQEFRNRDSRMYVSILMPFKSWYESNYGDKFVYEWIKNGNNESKTGFNFRKMLSLENDANGDGQATGDYPCIRYAEILLNYAEAANEYYGPDHEDVLGGQVVSPYEVLKLLRKRAGIEPGDDGMYGIKQNMTYDEMKEAIRLERRIELAFEGHRFFDVRRWMIADKTDNQMMHGFEITRDANGNETGRVVAVRQHTFRQAMYFFPIPYKETVKSDDLLQNPYYE